MTEILVSRAEAVKHNRTLAGCCSGQPPWPYPTYDLPSLTFPYKLHPTFQGSCFQQSPHRGKDALRILANAMNYLDHTYCRGSILEWIRSTPEGAAYLILRHLLTEVLEEPVKGERNCSSAA